MKTLLKVGTIILVLMSSPALSDAQIGLGARAGANLAWSELEEKVNDSWETDNTDIIPLFTAGLLAEISIGKYFAVQPEISFIQNGYKTTIGSDGSKQDYKVVLNYFEIPVLLKAKLGEGALQFNVLAGPTFGYAFDAITKTGGSSNKDIDFDKDNINQANWGATIGLGASLQLGTGAIFLDGRLGWGITDLDDSSTPNKNHWHTRNVNIGAGYIYPF